MSDLLDTDLLDRARAWIAEDPDETTRAELERLVDAVTRDPSGPEAADLADRVPGTTRSTSAIGDAVAARLV